jgi:hypothetical protein
MELVLHSRILGFRMLALVAGTKGVKLIAESIVDVSFILKKRSYSGGPTKNSEA